MEAGTKIIADTISAAKSGDTASFEKIVERFGGKVLALARRMLARTTDAEEAAQEVFFRAWRKLGLYDPEKGKFEHWLMRLASNELLNIASKKGRVIDFTSLSAADGESRIEDSFAAAENGGPPDGTEIEERVRRGILALPPDYRLVFTLRYLKDTSYYDIQRITGLPMGTVKTRIYRGREILKEKLKELL